MKVSLSFFNDNGDIGSAGATYEVELDVLPRMGEYLLLDIDNDDFTKVAKTTKPTSTFKVMYIVHGLEDYNGNHSNTVTMFLKTSYDLFG